MTSEKRSPADRIVAQPLLQAAVIWGFGTLLSLVDKAAEVPGVGTMKGNSTWILMTACILFYSVFSSILSLKVKDPNRYWRDAVIAFVALAVSAALIAWLISGVTMDDAGSFRWLYMVLAFGFLVFLSIMRLVRRIVEIAIRQDEKLRGGPR